jgi:hypothetical protein
MGPKNSVTVFPNLIEINHDRIEKDEKLKPKGQKRDLKALFAKLSIMRIKLKSSYSDFGFSLIKPVQRREDRNRNLG